MICFGRNAIACVIAFFHLLVFVLDFLHILPVIDFIKRQDGSASDPNSLLPVEFGFVSMAGIGNGVVFVAFALAFYKEVSLRAASVIALFFHGAWLISLVIFKHIWMGVFHENGSFNFFSFVFLNCIHSVLPLLVIVSSVRSAEEDDKKTS